MRYVCKCTLTLKYYTNETCHESLYIQMSFHSFPEEVEKEIEQVKKDECYSYLICFLMKFYSLK
jgi:hypothetical protein